MLAVLSLLQIRLWYGERSFSEIAYLEYQIKLKRIELKAQQLENDQLRSQVDYLTSSDDGIEEIAREDLQLILPGEVFVIVP